MITQPNTFDYLVLAGCLMALVGLWVLYFMRKPSYTHPAGTTTESIAAWLKKITK